VLCYVYIHVFKWHVDSLIRDVRFCYIDVVDPLLVLVMCAGSNYSIYSYNWSLQARRKEKNATDSR